MIVQFCEQFNVRPAVGWPVLAHDVLLRHEIIIIIIIIYMEREREREREMCMSIY